MLKPSVYLAAPLFNPRELAFNLELAFQLESQEIAVFLPQRDGSLLAHMLQSGLSQEVAERRIFEQDTTALRNADGLLAVLDGVAIDDGVAFEIGFASALGIECVGYQSDIRRALPSGNNPMIQRSLSSIFSTDADLTEWACAFRHRWSRTGLSRKDAFFASPAGPVRSI